MLIAELTVDDSSLNNVFRALVVNSNPDTINKPCKDIIVRDLQEDKPNILVNCYSVQELEESLIFLVNNGYEILKAKEIIPNDYDIGLVRDMSIEDEYDLKNLSIARRFRYYFTLKNPANNKGIFCLTFNPECDVKKQIRVKLDNGVIKCSTLQVVYDKLCGRQFKPIKRISTIQGNMSYYDL